MSIEITQEISKLIDRKKEQFISASDQIWTFAETRFEEFRSAALLSGILEKEGFSIEQSPAGLETGFIATFGAGSPVVALLGEYDALTELSQKAEIAEFDPVTPNANGHGCGHNLLGAGALAAAVAVKDYMVANGLPGTVKYYGCPAEESGYGKTFLAREGKFAGVDAAFSWHPASLNAVMHGSSNAVLHATFKFFGKSAHAAAAPHQGRSALDAVELMNIGANYLREHIVDKARLHYAITNSGGLSPNVVQKEAEVTYLIRAPKTDMVRALHDRVVDLARGAALMTGTTMEHTIEGACANLVPNSTLQAVMHKHLNELGAPEYTEAEYGYAKAIYESLSPEDKLEAGQTFGRELAALLAERPLPGFVAPYNDEREMWMAGSTDVADVSWNVPTAQCVTTTMAFGTPLHAWQTVAQGQSSYAHKGMLLAGKVMACAAVEVLRSEELAAAAKAELETRLDGHAYDCLVPKEITPPRMSEHQAVVRS